VQLGARVTILPVLVSPADTGYSAPDTGEALRDGQVVLDRYLGGLSIGYAVGPPFGDRLVTRGELRRLGLSLGWLRQQAADYLEAMVDRVRIHGQPPALVPFFAGAESSLVLATSVWENLAHRVPGQVVIAVPARDVVIVTGSHSPAGLARLRREVDRVFASTRRHLLTRDLFIRHGGRWHVYVTAEVSAGR